MYIKYNKNLILTARKLRKNLTPKEKKLWYQYLAKHPKRFIRQKIIDNYIVDFYCPSKKNSNRSRWKSTLYKRRDRI